MDIDHKYTPIVVLKPVLSGKILSKGLIVILLSPRPFFYCLVNSMPRDIVSYSDGNGCRLSCQYITDFVLPYT